MVLSNCLNILGRFHSILWTAPVLVIQKPSVIIQGLNNLQPRCYIFHFNENLFPRTWTQRHEKALSLTQHLFWLKEDSTLFLFHRLVSLVVQNSYEVTLMTRLNK